MRISVDRTKCIGTGMCEAAVPVVFEIDDGGRLVVLVESVAADQLDGVKAAVAGCPTGALRLIDE